MNSAFVSNKEISLTACAAIAVAAVIAGFLVFGLSFVLILIPFSVGAVAAYRIHTAVQAKRNIEITEANELHLATIEVLATAIDARDQIGCGHVRRTQKYALGIGEALGLGPNDLDALRTAALLHDIGKLGVPDHILSKPGRLNAAELEKAKTHSSVGAAILKEVDFPYPVVPTVLYHHEFWDGTGYPSGLAGENIPLTARILAVADTYDVLRSDRPYRPAMSREEARSHIANGSGHQFDPDVVQVFLKHLTQFEAAIERAGLAYPKVKASIEAGGAPGFVGQIQLANREVFALLELTRDFNESDNLPDMLATFARKVKDFVPFDTCAIYLMEENLDVAMAAHVEGDNRELLASKHCRLGQGATGVVLKRRAPEINVNPDLDFSVSHFDLIQEYLTMASLPLIADGVLVGAVSVYSASVERYAEEHIRVLTTIADIAAGAIAKLKDRALTRAHAMTDPMTGLPNARSLQAQFEREVARADRNDTSFQLLMLDLDGFKAVNDNFGHNSGDRLLRQIGEIIYGQLREYDFLARYGGDEFVAIVPDASDHHIADMCARIEKAVSSYRLKISADNIAAVGVSVGSASYPRDGETFDQIVVAADRVMYRRKSDRKARLAEGQLPSMGIVVGKEHAHAAEPLAPSGLVVELDESAVITNSIN